MIGIIFLKLLCLINNYIIYEQHWSGICCEVALPEFLLLDFLILVAFFYCMLL